MLQRNCCNDLDVYYLYNISFPLKNLRYLNLSDLPRKGNYRRQGSSFGEDNLSFYSFHRIQQDTLGSLLTSVQTLKAKEQMSIQKCYIHTVIVVYPFHMKQ